MSLAYKLYMIGNLISKSEIRDIIETPKNSFEAIDSYQTIVIDFEIENNQLNNIKRKNSSLDNFNVMFTKKIGGTSNSYYLYPNFEFQKEGNLYKKFQSSAYTIENSILIYASEENQGYSLLIYEYIKAYSEDVLNLKELEKNNYFLIFTINGKTFYELMPEVWENYFEDFVSPHITKKVKGKYIPHLEERIDVISQKKAMCGYNPNVKFFTYDNYHDYFKKQIIDKLPMSKESAIAIKKGWMYAINHLKFYHKGLEYIIIPSMVNNDNVVYKKLLEFLRRSKDNKTLASKEDSFIRRLSQQIEEFDESILNSISLDILFTKVDSTNLSVKIFATLDDVIPSRIRYVTKMMQKWKISDSYFIDTSQANIIYLKDYFGDIDSYAKATKSKGLENKIKQEKIELSKILLGYKQILYIDLLKRFEKFREVKYNFKDSKVEKRLVDSKEGSFKVKEWVQYPNSFVKNEDTVLSFLDNIEAIKNRR